MEDLSTKTLAELQAIAKELGLSYTRLKKEELIIMINSKIENDNTNNNIDSEVENVINTKENDIEIKNLSEVLEQINTITSQVNKKKARNEEIVRNNKYLDERIAEVKSSTVKITEEETSQIRNLNNIKIENSRQYSENTKIITELESKILKLDSIKTELAFGEYESKKLEYKSISDKLSLYPEHIATEIGKMVKEYNELSKLKSKLGEEVIVLCNDFGLKYEEIGIEQGKLTVSEKSQLVRRITDLSKITDRLENR